MRKHLKLSDSEFEQQFATRTIDPTIFNHEAHIRLAWIYIKKYGSEQAEKNIQKQLQALVKHVGAETKYHKTLTIAAMKAVAHFMSSTKADDFRDFIREFPQLNSNFKDLINSHYSFDIFSSQEAKQRFIEPDLVPFE